MKTNINTYVGSGGGGTEPIYFIVPDSGRPLRLKWLEGNTAPGVAWELDKEAEDFLLISSI